MLYGICEVVRPCIVWNRISGKTGQRLCCQTYSASRTLLGFMARLPSHKLCMARPIRWSYEPRVFLSRGMNKVLVALKSNHRQRECTHGWFPRPFLLQINPSYLNMPSISFSRNNHGSPAVERALCPANSTLATSVSVRFSRGPTSRVPDRAGSLRRRGDSLGARSQSDHESFLSP